MNIKDKLKKLDVTVFAFNDANNSRNAICDVYKAAKKAYYYPDAAAWDAYFAAEEVYGASRIMSEFMDAARDAAKSDFIAAGVALDNANRAVEDAAKVMNDADKKFNIRG